MVATKKRSGKAPVLHKKPRIEIISLVDTDEYDFFPHMKESGNEEQRKIIRDMKTGKYVPFMASVEYKAQFDKLQRLVKAAPLLDIYESSKMDSFDYSALYQKKMNRGYQNTEQIVKQFDKTDIPIQQRYYHNPLQYFDHVLLSDGYINSFAGTVVDAYLDFIMPKTLFPVLKLRNPDSIKNPQDQQKLIDKNHFIIDALLSVDNFYSDDGPEKRWKYLGTPIQKKFRALILNMLVFGRNCLVFENWKDLPQFKIKLPGKEEKEFPDIPNVIKWIQSIDMGMIQYDVFTGQLAGIYMYNTVPFISAEKMIYLVNKPYNPMIGSYMYGFSLMQRSIDPVRLYRRILAKNFAQFIRTSYSGMGYFMFDSTLYDPETRAAIRAQIKQSYKAGEIGIIDYAYIKDLDYKEVKITPEIGALIELQKALVNIVVGIMGMPASLIFDEAAANRSTMVGRVVSFINNQIEQLRTSISEQIASQWYIRNFRILFKDQHEILDMFTIGVDFEEMDLETRTEKVQRLLQEIQLNPYKDEWIGKVLGDQEYMDHIDPAKKKEQEEQKQNQPFYRSPVKPPGGTFTVSNEKGDVSKVNVEK